MTALNLPSPLLLMRKVFFINEVKSIKYTPYPFKNGFALSITIVRIVNNINS
jgi:hypothetical protein